MSRFDGSELTVFQKDLAHALKTTPIEAPVGRRRLLGTGTRYGGLVIGEFELYKVERPTFLIDTPHPHSGEFTGKQHEIDPSLPLLEWYMNARNVPQLVLDMMGFSLAQLPITVSPDFCAGIPKAGDKLAEAFAKNSGIESIQVLKKEETANGRRITSNGVEPQGNNNKLLLVDNAITSATSAEEAIEALLKRDWQIVGLVEVMDREEGGFPKLNRLYPDIQLLAALSCRPTFRFFSENKLINSYRYYRILRQRERAEIMAS